MTSSLNARNLSDFLHQMYAMQDIPSLMKTICDGLTGMIPGDNVAVARCHAERRALSAVCAERPFGHAHFLPEIVRGQLLASHPFWDVALHPSYPVKSVSDFLSARGWKEHPYYQEFIKDDGFLDHLEVEVDVAGTAYTTIDVLRSKRGFSEHDRLTLLMLKPHFEQAFRNARTVERHALLARTGVDPTLSALRVTTEGQLEDMPMQGRNDVPIPKSVQAWIRLQVGRLNRGVVDQDIPPMQWNHRGQTVVFRLHRQWGVEGYVLSFRKVGVDTMGTVGLTPRECEVMQWVCEGKSNSDIATILAISPHTVKDHLKQIYMKLHVENRTAAARVWSGRCGKKDECAEG